MGKKSEFTVVLDELRAEVKRRRQEINKADPIEFGTEKVRREQALRRMDKMTEGERKEYLERVGEDEVIRMIRGS